MVTFWSKITDLIYQFNLNPLLGSSPDLVCFKHVCEGGGVFNLAKIMVSILPGAHDGLLILLKIREQKPKHMKLGVRSRSRRSKTTSTWISSHDVLRSCSIITSYHLTIGKGGLNKFRSLKGGGGLLERAHLLERGINGGFTVKREPTLRSNTS